MKKFLLVAVVAIIGLGACGSTPAPEVTKTVIQEVPAAPAISSTTQNELDMVDAIRSQNSDFYGADAETIIDVAYKFCEALRAGSSLEELGQMGADTIGTDALAALGAGAIIYLCPDQKYRVS